MAKTVCAHCGYKNKGSVAICSNCGYYLLDSQLGISSSLHSSSVSARNTQTTAYSPPAGTSAAEALSGSTIEIKSKKGLHRWLPTIVSFGPFAAFVLLEYFAKLPPIYFIPFLFAIMFLSPIARRNAIGIRFFAKGFGVRNAGRNEVFYYSNIESVKTSTMPSGMQSLSMSLAGASAPVTLVFDSMNTFRMTVMQLRRRRIEITAE